jgi:hypothetical protein
MYIESVTKKPPNNFIQPTPGEYGGFLEKFVAASADA